MEDLTPELLLLAEVVDNLERVARCYRFDEMYEVDGGVIVGIVGDRSDHPERNAKLETHLRDCCAFHFHC